MRYDSMIPFASGEMYTAQGRLCTHWQEAPKHSKMVGNQMEAMCVIMCLLGE